MLWAAGSSSDCQLGIPTEEDQYAFAPVNSNLLASHEIVDIAAGALHTLFLTKGSDYQLHVIGCGDNARGQLGQLSRHVREPVQLLRHQSVAGVYASWQTSFVHFSNPHEDQSDTIESQGSNDLGELGSDSKQAQDPMMNTVALEPVWPRAGECFVVSKISAGPRHVVALLQSKKSTRSRALVGWGAARKGELGAERAQSHRKPVNVVFKGPANETLDHDSIEDVCALLQHTAVLFHSSAGWQVGIYGASKLAGPHGHRFIDLSPRIHASITPEPSNLFLRACWSTLFVWTTDEDSAQYKVLGASHLGQHGIPVDPSATNSESRHQNLRTLHYATLKGKVLQVATGSEHTLVLVQRRDGSTTLLAWGWNEHGNLGVGTTVNVDQPQEVHFGPADKSQPVRVFAGNGTSFITSQANDVRKI